jgi:hypothetical protein
VGWEILKIRSKKYQNFYLFIFFLLKFDFESCDTSVLKRQGKVRYFTADTVSCYLIDEMKYFFHKSAHEKRIFRLFLASIQQLRRSQSHANKQREKK